VVESAASRDILCQGSVDGSVFGFETAEFHGLVYETFVQFQIGPHNAILGYAVSRSN